MNLKAIQPELASAANQDSVAEPGLEASLFRGISRERRRKQIVKRIDLLTRK